ncbi:MAG: hypothetical protein ABSG86_32360 [Thermoguttaceae bacterium]
MMTSPNTGEPQPRAARYEANGLRNEQRAGVERQRCLNVEIVDGRTAISAAMCGQET